MKALQNAGKKYPDLRKPLHVWVTIIEKNEFHSLNDFKNSMKNTDKVMNCVVFNIQGNNYRLIAKPDYINQRLLVKEVLTHAEYDKEKWKKGCS
jgi:mRNA interferase HigB